MLSTLSGSPSPEAEMAISTFMRFRHDLRGALSRCGSGRELMERGFEWDIELAAEHAVSSFTPVLVQDRFTDPASSPS